MRALPLEMTTAPDTRSSIAYLWWLARQQSGVLFAAIALGIIGFACQAVMPYAVGAALDSGLENGVSPELARWAGIMAAAAVIQVLAGLVQHRYDIVNWLRAAYASSTLIDDHVTTTGDAISTELPTGEVVATVASDALRTGELYAAASRFVGSVFAYVAVAGLMLWVSPLLGTIVAVGLPAIAAILALVVRPLQRQQQAQREAQGRLTTLGADTVSGLRILRGIGGERVFAGRYQAQSQRVRWAGVKVAQTQSWLDALQILLPGILVTVILWIGARQAVAGTITPGQLVTFYGYTAFLAWPLQNITETLQFMTRANVASRKIVRVLSVAPATSDVDDPREMPGPDAALVDEVTGTRVAPGQVSALVCQDPDEAARVATRLGRFDDDAEQPTPVLLGDAPLRELPIAAVRERIVVAEAAPALFSGTLRRELDVRAHADDEAIYAALHVADAQDVLDSTPGGLDGELPEKGRSLSGGQRQRVALARALLTDAPALVLIEPTSAVDAHTESRIATRLPAARAGKATLIVTASPLVLDHVDTIQVLRGGRVIATGTHRDLMARTDEAAEHYRRVVGRSMTQEAQSAPHPQHLDSAERTVEAP